MAISNIDNGESGSSVRSKLNAVIAATNNGAVLPVNSTNGSRLDIGTWDNESGGQGGISLFCVVGYELNFQQGVMTIYMDGNSTPISLPLNSSLKFLAGKSINDLDDTTAVDVNARQLKNASGDVLLDWSDTTLNGIGNFPIVQLNNVDTFLSPTDCGKCFTDEQTSYWRWIEMPNASECLGKPGIMFIAARPYGGYRNRPVMTIYPRWEVEGDDGPSRIYFSVGAQMDLDAISPCNDGDTILLTAEACNLVRFYIGSSRPSDPTPGQTVTGITSGATGVLRYADRYVLILANVSGDFQNGETITFDNAAPESIQSEPTNITSRWRAQTFTGVWDNRND